MFYFVMYILIGLVIVPITEYVYQRAKAKKRWEPFVFYVTPKDCLIDAGWVLIWPIAFCILVNDGLFLIGYYLEYSSWWNKKIILIDKNTKE